MVEERCKTARPPVEVIEPGHLAHCFRHEEVAAQERAVDYFAAFQSEAERILSAGVATDVIDAAAGAQERPKAKS